MPAVITLDVVMQDMDGWSTLRILKEDPELSKLTLCCGIDPKFSVDVTPVSALCHERGLAILLTSDKSGFL
jgi:CheY-like chemotaxis protein